MLGQIQCDRAPSRNAQIRAARLFFENVERAEVDMRLEHARHRKRKGRRRIAVGKGKAERLALRLAMNLALPGVAVHAEQIALCATSAVSASSVSR